MHQSLPQCKNVRYLVLFSVFVNGRDYISWNEWALTQFGGGGEVGWVVGGRRSLTGCLPVADCRLTEWDDKQRSVVLGTNGHAAVESDIDVYTQVLLPCDSVGRERE